MANPGPDSRFGFDPASETPIVEMSIDIGLMRVDDPIPFLRIYGNGEVWVHYPAYMVKAGDYHMDLAPDELEDILAELESFGLFDFDAEAVKTERAAIERERLDLQRRQGQTVVLTNRSDDETTIIRIALDRYLPSDGGPTREDVAVRAAWHALTWEAQTFPEIAALGGLDQAADLLRELAEDPELRRWHDAE